MVDLQIHTQATPHHAFWEPTALVQAAVQAGIAVLAATDHNTVASVRALMHAGQLADIEVIPGVEIDSGFAGKLWHILVYGVAPENSELLELCASVYQRNLRDAAALRLQLAAQGFALPQLDALGRPANVADVGAALARGNQLAGRVANETDESAGMRVILTMPNAYQPVQADEIVRLAHRQGGLVVLAHPGRSNGVYAVPADERDIAALVEAGIDGLEVYYETHTPEQQAFYAVQARRLRLLVTGGSDSHGPTQRLARWPIDLVADFLDAVRSRM
ncbi:MAG: PHP domain-containing protein [Roseiflexaceae bacterium]|nr:PHP domain-containing protein [Roseiflexaceae bacterium]